MGSDSGLGPASAWGFAVPAPASAGGSERTGPWHRQVWAGVARAPWRFSGFPMRRTLPPATPLWVPSEADLGAGECQHCRHATWHLVSSGVPSELRCCWEKPLPQRRDLQTGFELSKAQAVISTEIRASNKQPPPSGFPARPWGVRAA